MKYIFILQILLLTSFGISAQTDYYWYKGEKVFLTKIPGKKFIIYQNIQDTSGLKKITELPDAIIIGHGIFKTSKSIVTYKGKKNESQNWAMLSSSLTSEKKLTEQDQIVYESNFYKTEQEVEAGLSHLFYVKLKNPTDANILEQLASENNVEIIGNNKFMPLWYTLSCTKYSKGNALEMANVFYESNLFAGSEPDLMTDDTPFCTNDPHFNEQWGLNNSGQYGGTGIDINFCQSRQITTGDQNIVIAVLDQGFEMNHPDFANVHAQSFDTESGTSPAQVLGDHGTACAGIIGANSNNSIGISGIAPDCQIMSISNSLAGIPNSRQRRADGINFAWQNGAAVISNSWGSSVQFQIIDDAIDNALTQGRNGLGTVVVFAAGNDNGGVSYPANSNSEIITVGALSPCGERKSPNSCDGETTWGSNFGAELDIMAPGVLIPTTDRQGNNGYNPNVAIHNLSGGSLVNSDYTDDDYTVWFNGTSAACPHVAAIAGLILSRNSHLTQLQVANIIESTAQKVGGYNYQNTVGRPNGTWDDEMGYGLVDAFAAVQACPTTTIENQTITTDTHVYCDRQYSRKLLWSIEKTLNHEKSEVQYRVYVSIDYFRNGM